MSMGPQEKEQNASIGTLNAVRYSAKTLTVGFFKDPTFYIFYLSLSAALIALLFDHDLPRPFYVILIILAIVRGFGFLIIKSSVIDEEKTS